MKSTRFKKALIQGAPHLFENGAGRQEKDQEVLRETLREARRCTQDGIVINTFMLENNYQFVNFVDKITRINRGRAFYTSPNKLGEYILVDYATNRRKHFTG